MGILVGRWGQMVVELRTVGPISKANRGNEYENAAAHAFPPERELQPDSMSTTEDLREMLIRVIETLPERFRKVVILYYTDNVTMKEIGGRLGINQSRVSQIHKEALEMMAIALQSAGVHLGAPVT